MLAQEPWAFTQAEIRATTLAAARTLYYDEAVRRSRDADRSRQSVRPDGEAAVMPSRDEWVSTYEGIYGKVKDFGADWDRLNAVGGG